MYANAVIGFSIADDVCTLFACVHARPKLWLLKKYYALLCLSLITRPCRGRRPKTLSYLLDISNLAMNVVIVHLTALLIYRYVWGLQPTVLSPMSYMYYLYMYI